MLVTILYLGLNSYYIANMECVSCRTADCECDFALVRERFLSYSNGIVNSFVYSLNCNIACRHCEVELSGLIVELNCNSLLNAVSYLNASNLITIGSGNCTGNILAHAKLCFRNFKVVLTVHAVSRDRIFLNIVLNAYSLTCCCGNDVLAGVMIGCYFIIAIVNSDRCVTIGGLDLDLDLIAVDSHYGAGELSSFSCCGKVLECNDTAHDVGCSDLILCCGSYCNSNFTVGHCERKLIAGQGEINGLVAACNGDVVLVDPVVLIRCDGECYSGIYLNILNIALDLAVNSVNSNVVANRCILYRHTADFCSRHCELKLAGFLVVYCRSCGCFLSAIRGICILNSCNCVALIGSDFDFNSAVCCRAFRYNRCSLCAICVFTVGGVVHVLRICSGNAVCLCRSSYPNNYRLQGADGIYFINCGNNCRLAVDGFALVAGAFNCLVGNHDVLIAGVCSNLELNGSLNIELAACCRNSTLFLSSRDSNVRCGYSCNCIVDRCSGENDLNILRRHCELAIGYFNIVSGLFAGDLQRVVIAVSLCVCDGHFLAEVVSLRCFISYLNGKPALADIDDLVTDHCERAVYSYFAVRHCKCICICRFGSCQVNGYGLTALVVNICHLECAASLRDILITLAGSNSDGNNIAGSCLIGNIYPAVLIVLGLCSVVGDGVFPCGSHELQGAVCIDLSNNVLNGTVCPGGILCELDLSVGSYIVEVVYLIAACRLYFNSKALAVVYFCRNCDLSDSVCLFIGNSILCNTAGVSYCNGCVYGVRNGEGICAVLGLFCLDGLSANDVSNSAYGIAGLACGLDGNYIACMYLSCALVFCIICANDGDLSAGHVSVVCNGELKGL